MSPGEAAAAQAADQGLALAAGLAGRAAEALDALRRVVDRTIATHGDLDAALRLIEAVEMAMARRRLSIGPATGVLYTLLGMAALGRERPDVALTCGAAAAASRPEDAAALHLAGAALARAGRHDEALGHLTRATELWPVVARYEQSLGETLLALGRTEAAIAMLRQSVEHGPEVALAHYSLAQALSDAGQASEAIEALDRARACHPPASPATLLRATNLLKLGRFIEGFGEYEVRPHRPREACPGSPVPEWTGGPLDGRRILLLSEQGLGDRLQFLRYAAVLKERGAWVAVACPASLARLIGRARGVDLALAYGVPALDIDLWAPLMSLPHRLETTVESVPAPVPYLLPEPDRVETWRAWLDAASPSGRALRVGIAWQGNPASGTEVGRSVPLAALAPLASLPGVHLVSLQRHHGIEQLADWPAGLPLSRPGPDFDAGPDAFLDTAALMASLDLVVTSDTSVAHLAGALGRPTWVLLQRHPEWRWMLDRPDSPWYPTMTLFRQARAGDWAEVVERVAAALAARVAALGLP